jgi:hypothetical protein
MKKINLIVLLLAINHFAIGQGLDWAHFTTGMPSGHYSTSSPNGKVSALDAFGNIYVTGNNGYLEKYTTSGNFVWSKIIQGDGYSVEADMDGFIYIIGDYSQVAFVEKRNSLGDLIWRRNFGTQSFGIDITVDNQHNIYAAGSTRETLDLDPGAGTFLVDTSGAYLIKFDSGGNFLWAYIDHDDPFQVELPYKYNNAVALDNADNVYVAGVYGGLTTQDGYVRKLNADGTLAWSKEYIATGPMGQPLGEDIRDIKVSNSNYVYITGVTKYAPGDGSDIIVQKMDTAGNQVWWKEIAGSRYLWTGALDVDEDDNVYVTGSTATGQQGADFDPGPGTTSFPTWGYPAMYLWKLTSAGDYEWADLHYISQPHYFDYFSYGYNIHVDDQCNVYAVGVVDGDIDVDPGAGVYNLNGNNLFLEKITCNTTEANNIANNANVTSVYPNPSTGEINISSPFTIQSVQITDVIGRVVYSASPESKIYKAEADIVNGMYYITVTTDNGTTTDKLVISK